jgi:hypothetical protein
MMAFVDTFVCVHKEESWTHLKPEANAYTSKQTPHINGEVSKYDSS